VRVDFLGAPLTDLRDAAGFHLLNPARLVRAALGGALVPRVVTDMRDARVDVDDRLRAVIGALVAEWGARMTAPARDAAVPPALPVPAGDGEDGRGRPEARGGGGGGDAEAAAVAGRRVREAVEREAPLVRRKVDEYVHDRRTRDMLLRAVLEDVLRRYAEFLGRIGFGSGGGRRKGRGKGKGREDEVWEEDVFGEWAGKVLGLEGVELDGDEMESS
jgi:conserved oligomeric Golgi complex subunit 3